MSGAILSIAGTIYQGHRRFGDISRGRKCFLMSFSALSCAQSCPVRHLDTADGDCRSFYFHLLIKSTFLVKNGLLCLCNKQNNTWLFSDIKISLLVFVLEFCGFPNCLDRGKCRKLLMLLGVIREIVVSSDWFGCVLFISFYVAKLFSESVT